MDDDWDLAEVLDPDGPSADDLDRFGDEMMRCSSSGREVYDQAEICPICGGPVHGASKTPRWTIGIVVLLVVVIALFWVL